MRIIVRGGVFEVDLAEWKCYSIYWPGETFDILRGTWYGHLHITLFLKEKHVAMTNRFYENTWQPLQCEYADKVEQEHLQRFLNHKMADYVWDHSTSSRLEKQVRFTLPHRLDESRVGKDCNYLFLLLWRLCLWFSWLLAGKQIHNPVGSDLRVCMYVHVCVLGD